MKKLNLAVKTATILIVDDDPNIRRVVAELFRMDNYRIFDAPDAEEALKIIQDDPIDVLVTDLGLPGMSGWDLAKAARREKSDIRIVAITSWQGTEAEKRLDEYQMNGVVWKPFRFDQIRAEVARLVSELS